MKTYASEQVSLLCVTLPWPRSLYVIVGVLYASVYCPSEPCTIGFMAQEEGHKIKVPIMLFVML